jgi:patatin-like phospholipase/acyl hydrolase
MQPSLLQRPRLIFPEHRVGQDNLIDGGLIANAPDALALMRALGRFAKQPDRVRIVSVGTAGPSATDLSRAARGYGAIRWMLSRKLFDVTIKAQEALSINLASEVLGNRYIRIDAEPSTKQSSAIGLDITSQQATDTLLQMASSAVSRLPTDQVSVLEAILRRPP